MTKWEKCHGGDSAPFNAPFLGLAVDLVQGESPPNSLSGRAFFMVGVARIELATPAMSTQCSTTELHAHSGWQLDGGIGRCKPVLSEVEGARGGS
jgi:hypothetical protein